MTDPRSLHEQVADLRDELASFRREYIRSIGAVTEVMIVQEQLEPYALRSELDDLRLELRDLTATPFDTER